VLSFCVCHFGLSFGLSVCSFVFISLYGGLPNKQVNANEGDLRPVKVRAVGAFSKPQCLYLPAAPALTGLQCGYLCFKGATLRFDRTHRCNHVCLCAHKAESASKHFFWLLFDL
jgi:hypothetical protein